MQLSIIIVNYNVKYFIEQALKSVQKAAAGLDVEIIVVDNNSVDGSVQMIREAFPDVVLIANDKNVGFSVANNQGIQTAKGKYVLLLNPDTIVSENTFQTTIEFMEAHPKAGALGVKMYDGKGIYLPESKRGLPTPATALYKMTGLSALFPKSKIFNRYYLGHLSDNEVHEIEILAGAFMLMRKSVLEEIGLLDETFFMYGEDIDLSYRILKAGYKNYFFPHTQIIHYKGESTKKGSLNYVRMFYNAMIIFARKHFTSNKAKFYILGIQIAIYLRAFIAIIQRFTSMLLPPAIDAALIYVGMWAIKDFYQNNIKAAEGFSYGPEYMFINVPLYIAIWLITVFLSGGYDKPIRLSRIVRGVLTGTLIISAVYGFLPESLRFSRAMILLGCAWSALALTIRPWLWQTIKHGRVNWQTEDRKRALIIGKEDECKRVRSLLYEADVNIDVVGYVWPDEQSPNYQQIYIGHLGQLKEMVQVFTIDELIFCAKDISTQQTMAYMLQIGSHVNYKTVPPESLSIIGSNSKNTAGDLYTIDINLQLHQQRHQRNKRLLDIAVCTISLFLFPLIFFLVEKPLHFWHNWLKVVLAQLSWVGYVPIPNTNKVELPSIKKGVLTPLDMFTEPNSLESHTIQRLNLLYAKDYHPQTDVNIITKAIKKMGR